AGLQEARERYRFVFLDCPPSLGPLTVNALAAADKVLVPVQAEYYALEGLAQLVSSVELVKRRLNPRLEIGGVLLTMVDGRTRLASDVAAEVRRHFGPLVFTTTVPRSVRVAEAPCHGLPAIAYDRRSAGADAYWKVAMGLVENVAREALSPVEEARAYAVLVDEFGLSLGEIAERVGRSKPSVSNRLRLLELPDEVLGMLDRQLLSEGHARAVLAVPDHDGRRRLAKRI